MTGRISRRALFLLAFALLVLAPVAAQDEAPAANTPALFRLSSGKTVMYFFGSVHVGSADMYPLPEAVAKAFAGSDNLVVEVNVQDVSPAQVMDLFNKKLSYPATDSLEKHLTPEYRDKLKALLEGYGLPWERFVRFKPAVIMSILTEFGAAGLGYRPEDGIDLYFMKEAGAKKKKVLQLESFAEQVEMLAGIPEEGQDLMLASSIDDMATLKEDLAVVVDVWKKGDLDGCYALEEKGLVDVPALASVFKVLVTDRNKTMEQRLKTLIAKGGTYFVVVGAAHFAGPGNIVELLREDGFTVTRL
jgi:uncharacterized protein YbaP (TraB family)